jgi:transposase
MQTLVERGCGLDVHQATVVACLLMVSPRGKVHKQMRTFGTTTRELLSLRQWLLSEGCTHVAMESTGVYWKPVYAILEGALEIVIANAQHVKKVPGRKSDVKDAEWLADLLCHGLLRSSFVPPKPIRELRDLTRYRRKLVESQTAERNRLLKLLETTNIKLASVACDVFGVSGQLMLKALLEGKASPQEMAQLAKRRLRSKIPQLELALEGKMEPHQSFPFTAATGSTPSSRARSDHSRATHSGEATALHSAAHFTTGNPGCGLDTWRPLTLRPELRGPTSGCVSFSCSSRNVFSVMAAGLDRSMKPFFESYKKTCANHGLFSRSESSFLSLSESESSSGDGNCSLACSAKK